MVGFVSIVIFSIPLSTTNKMQRYTIFFIIVKFYMFRAVSPPIIRSSRTLHIASGMCTVLELLMMDGETSRNMLVL